MTVEITNYTFVAASKTVTFNDYVTIDLANIISVLNITTGEKLYFAGLSGLTGSVATNVLTYTSSSPLSSDTDSLLIFYDDPLISPGNPITIPSPLSIKEVSSTTPVQSSPSVTNVNTLILALNADRLGATIYNEGAATCYLKLGATASITSYTLQIVTGGYYEVPFDYTGIIDGITSAGTAQLRVTEIT